MREHTDRARFNASDCKNGAGLYDHSKLTRSETSELTAAEHRRNDPAASGISPDLIGNPWHI
jgi:hypothetical protein